MKKLFIVCAFILSFNVFATTGADVCMSQSFDSYKAACMGVVNKGFIDHNAAEVCIGLSFDRNKNACLEAALDKEYSADEAAVCKSLSFDRNVVECIQNTGRKVVIQDDVEISAEIKLERIEKLALKAKKQLRRGDIIDAIITIDRILDLATVNLY